MMIYESATPCAAGPACRDWDPITKTAGDTDRHPLCQLDLDANSRAIRALPLDWRDLEQLMPPALGVWGDGTPHGDGGHPIPLNAHIEALQAAIWWLATAWEEAVRDHTHLADLPRRRPTPPGRRDWAVYPDGTTVQLLRPGRLEHPTGLDRPMRPGPVDVVRGARLLSVHIGALSDLPAVGMLGYPLEALCGSPSGRRNGRDRMPPDPRWDAAIQTGAGVYAEVPGWQGALDLAALHRRATAVLGLTKPVRRLPGDCSGCGRPDLRQDQPRYRGDNPLVYCGGCETTWTYDEYARYAGLWEAAA